MSAPGGPLCAPPAPAALREQIVDGDPRLRPGERRDRLAGAVRGDVAVGVSGRIAVDLEPDMRAERGSWSVYLLCWRRHGGLQYIGMSQDVDRRINAHRKAGRLPFAQLGDSAIEVLHFGLDVYAACDAERREIMARRTMTPHGYNESSGGEYAGSRSDTLFSADHLHRLSRAAVGVERMDRATHEEEAGNLAASGVEAVMERYWEACSVVVELWRSGVYVGRIARRAGLGHGYIYGMLRAAGENPK